MKNPWTTVLGYIALVGAICNAIVAVAHGGNVADAFSIVNGALVTAGLIGIKAADGGH